MGKTIVLRAVPRQVGGAFLTMKDFIDAQKGHSTSAASINAYKPDDYRFLCTILLTSCSRRAVAAKDEVA